MNHLHCVLCVSAVQILVFSPEASAQPPDVDKQLLDDLSPGEDIGEAPENPVTRILDHMQQSEKRLRDGDTSEETIQLQRGIANDLAELIAKMRRQQPRSTASQSQSSSGKMPQETSANSNDATAGGEDSDLSSAPPNVPVGRGVWGHLPKKIREQIDHSAIEEFLPGFEKMIEAYYQRLATEGESMPRQN